MHAGALISLLHFIVLNAGVDTTTVLANSFHKHVKSAGHCRVWWQLIPFPDGRSGGMRTTYIYISLYGRSTESVSVVGHGLVIVSLEVIKV